MDHNITSALDMSFLDRAMHYRCAVHDRENDRVCNELNASMTASDTMLKLFVIPSSVILFSALTISISAPYFFYHSYVEIAEYQVFNFMLGKKFSLTLHNCLT
ncbi:hypothetical protein A359_05200 [secondary endosymbiont of Ctenarytaina eucalypti]|uniref:Uncharacterized protein n=1 Tax=secondary endosymbiont of Ctenarytaina eucalypti TaxID=1199245 RepID=J3TFE6_9ENTR|nr:hypothetical protein A359_05200 [secondary endosymbiont of Ctenarytaina eucalypti]